MADETAAEKTTIRLPSKGTLRSLDTIGDQLKKVISEKTGEWGKAVAEAVSKKKLNKKAHGIYRSLRSMSDERLAETIAHLDHYIDVGGLRKRAGMQLSLMDREMPSEDELNAEDDALDADTGTPEGETDLRPATLREKTAGGLELLKEKTVHKH